ncbi:dTMP kinase [Desulfomicrobium orale]|uniref:Thymidylate kinase n=1 Tax=Desulfomicrobium orale DSM 12838 TaxID=888061 RepID=A0A0X8JPG4_9BACT|nr:dTMP kinase [Desulfomicrobium orale]AMD92564.1 thymidylate kinase [Desulfomicrobium orale DSM 12838]
MFITLEGMEGCGKSTQCALLVEHFTRLGFDVLRTLEPGGSVLGKELRRILLDPANSDLSPVSELFLYLADRAQHVGTVIRPALAQDRVVICDRFADSTVVYQGYGRGLEPSLLRQLNDTAVQGLWPDATVLLDLAPEQGLRRALTRNMRENKARTEGRFEAESLAFHTRVREGYLTWAALNRERFLVVDADRTPEQVFAAILCGLEEKGLV